MCLAVMAAGATIRDAGSGMVERGHGETAETCAMTHQTILSRHRQRHVRRRLTDRSRSIVTGHAGRRRHITDERQVRMIVRSAEPVVPLWIMARTTILRRFQMSG